MMQMMSSMKGEITRLTEKCDRMERSIDTMQTTQNANYNTTNQMKRTINAMQTAQTTHSQNTNSRFDDVDNKQKYHEILLRNQQWKYSAPHLSDEYWDDLDEDEAAATAADSFLTQIKQRTEEMRYGTGDGKVLINAPLFIYNEEFLPHWKEFANALAQHQYCLKCLPKDTETKLVLCDMDLPDTVLDLLSKAFESTHFTRFALRDNNIGQSGIDFALKYLKSNQIMEQFALVENPINNMEQIRQLCQIVKEHPSIEVLSLDSCRGEEIDGHEMLQLIMSAGKSKLKSLMLSNNDIATGGDTFISDFLADNPILVWLKLDGNQLDDNDAVAIAGALKKNTNLRDLHLTDNNITKAGWVALRKAEFDDTSLNSASDCNHTCCIKYPSGDDEIQGLDTSEMNGDTNSGFCFAPMYVRQKKIYSVLSSRNRECSNVGHFDDVPVELLPDILCSIERYSEYHIHDHAPPQGADDVKPISLMFEILQRWDKSSSL